MQSSNPNDRYIFPIPQIKFSLVGIMALCMQKCIVKDVALTNVICDTAHPCLTETTYLTCNDQQEPDHNQHTLGKAG